MGEFDIHQLDGVDPSSDQAEKELQRYQDVLLNGFHGSPEATEPPGDRTGIGYWASAMIGLGFKYLGATLPRMRMMDAEEILTELFPRKISLSSPEEADVVIPELSAFWRYLGREYRLANAPAILKLLGDVQPEFKATMNDPSKFGMAKSFVMKGRAAGFDMSDREQLQRFAALYNAGLAAEQEPRGPAQPRTPTSGSSRKLRKRIQKLSSQAPRNNRKKRR